MIRQNCILDKSRSKLCIVFGTIGIKIEIIVAHKTRNYDMEVNEIYYFDDNF